MVQKLRSDNEIERAGRKRRRRRITPNDTNGGQILVLLCGNARRDRLGFQADDFSRDVTAATPRMNRRGNIGAAGADVENRDRLVRYMLQGALKRQQHGARTVEVAVEPAQISQVSG